MELKVIDQKKNRLVLEVSGEDHTFCNVLKKELWNDKHVKAASYNIKHPMVSHPHIIVETDGSETPQDDLRAALEAQPTAAWALLGVLAARFRENA